MRARARWVVGLTLAPSVALLLGFLGCVDLFHSTNFETLCELDATACGSGSDAGRDARSRSDTGDDGRVQPHDASTDSRRGDAPHDAGIDAPPTNFCLWTPDSAAGMAEHACLWLGACAGTAGANEYGHCYALAALAYDCVANPNQQVRGPVHAYWDALSKATSCHDVLNAVFAGTPPSTCASSGCAGAAGAVNTQCADGGLTSAENCTARGLGCGQFGCTNPVFDCTEAGTVPQCEDAGHVLHLCRVVGDAAAPSDIGKDCTNFGAGMCAVVQEAGVGGCVPNDASMPCTASASAACSTNDAGDTVVTGCATGVTEQINCTALGAPSPFLDCMGAAATSRSDLASVCYAPTSAAGSCNGGNVNDHGGASGPVSGSCADAGLRACRLVGGSPACSPPTGQ